jgi:hypothetical protein
MGRMSALAYAAERKRSPRRSPMRVKAICSVDRPCSPSFLVPVNGGYFNDTWKSRCCGKKAGAHNVPCDCWQRTVESAKRKLNAYKN